MPIYEYSCQSCEKTIDVLQKVSDPTPETCSACGATGSLTRLVSRSSFVLKGGGWYSDLYGSTKKDGASTSSDSGSAASTSTASSSGGAASSSGSTASTSSSSSSSTAPAPAPAPAASKS
jgi:putative FmdB family regulatory protein